MAHTIPVKYIYGGSIDSIRSHASCPTLSSAAGSAIALLDAVLVNGIAPVTVTSLTIDSNGFATVTSAAHGYNKVPTVIALSGCDQTAMNGEWEITATSTNTVTLDVTDSGLTSTTITGANIVMKIAPLGWSKVFYDMNNFIAVYRSNDPLSRRHFLRVDDSDGPSVTPRFTYIRGYEMIMSTADVGVYPYPLTSSFGRGLGFPRDYNTNPGVWLTTGSTSVSWTLVGTSRQFYLFTHFYQGADSRMRMLTFFGDLVSYVPGDAGASFICSATSFSNNYSINPPHTMASTSIGYCPRNASRLNTLSAQQLRLLSPPALSTMTYIGNNPAFSEPDPYTNKMFLYYPVLFADSNILTTIRGEFPGMAVSMSDVLSLPANYTPNTILTISGERFMYQPLYTFSGVFGHTFVSIDRDWNIPLL